MKLTKKMKINKKQIERTLTEFICDRIKDLFFRIKETTDHSASFVTLYVSKEEAILLQDALSVYFVAEKEKEK